MWASSLNKQMWFLLRSILFSLTSEFVADWLLNVLAGDNWETSYVYLMIQLPHYLLKLFEENLSIIISSNMVKLIEDNLHSCLEIWNIFSSVQIDISHEITCYFIGVYIIKLALLPGWNFSLCWNLPFSRCLWLYQALRQSVMAYNKYSMTRFIYTPGRKNMGRYFNSKFMIIFSTYHPANPAINQHTTAR